MAPSKDFEWLGKMISLKVRLAGKVLKHKIGPRRVLCMPQLGSVHVCRGVTYARGAPFKSSTPGIEARILAIQWARFAA
jgi:hypothetical protein